MQRLASWLMRRATRRLPDFIIGSEDNPYLLRWWLIPRNPVFNVYLHCFLRSDDDRALHCHPWANLSVLLRGRYIEHTAHADGNPQQRVLWAGDWRLRWRGGIRHRVELYPGERAWTLFLTGPRYREWGFHCPKGFVHWQDFTNAADKGLVGKGCDQ